MKVETDVVGRGVAFPLHVDHTGAIATVTGPEAVARGMTLVLSTAPGERVMRPEFGCAIWELLFAPVNPNTLGLMAQHVREAIGRWEPRVDLEEVVVRPDPADAARVEIDISYTIRTTNDRRNLVFPFYVIPSESPQ
ncbi:MAG: GPW/gp25 family protein [Acidimicrobiales bacterium]